MTWLAVYAQHGSRNYGKISPTACGKSCWATRAADRKLFAEDLPNG